MARNPSVQEFIDNTGPLLEAEEKLLEACRAGGGCRFGPRPEVHRTDREVRVEFLKILILGGTKGCGLDPSGVWLEGAWISGQLNLSFRRAVGQIVLKKCRFVEKPLIEQTRFDTLALEGSHLPGLWAQGVQVTGSLFLRGVTATGTVAVNSAQVGGQLDCEGATLDGAGGKALNAQGVTCGQGLFLRGVTATGTVAVNSAQVGGQLACEGATLDGAGGEALNAQGVTCGQDLFLRSIGATGAVDVGGAQIGGQLDCTGATLDGAGGEALNAQGVTCGQGLFLRSIGATGTVDVGGAQIGGQMSFTGAKLDGAGGKALNAQRLRVTEGLVWRDGTVANGVVDLTAAHAGDLADDLQSWPDGERLILDGFTYDRIDGPLGAAERIDWLRKGTVWNGEFFPQPYRQLARVLWNMGHDRAARQVRMALAEDMARHERGRLWWSYRGEMRALGATYSAPIADYDQNKGDQQRILLRAARSAARARWNGVVDASSRWVIGYGFAPWRSVGWLVLLMSIAATMAAMTWNEGSFAPNSAPILVSDRWHAALSADNPAQAWSEDEFGGKDWDSFSAIAYGADVVIPIVPFGQTDAWAPSTRGPWGTGLWWGRWVLTALGWIVTALGAAAVTGLIQRDKD